MSFGGVRCGYDLTKKSHKGISSLSFGTVEWKWKWNASPRNLRIYFLFLVPGAALGVEKGGSG